MQELLARQMAASVGGPVFPGLPPPHHHFPLYGSAAAAPPPIAPLGQLAPGTGKDGSVSVSSASSPASSASAALPASVGGVSDDGQSNYVQHLQSKPHTHIHTLCNLVILCWFATTKYRAILLGEHGGLRRRRKEEEEEKEVKRKRGRGGGRRGRRSKKIKGREE